ncbi:hypothetical protein ACJ41O_012574 [Fusarium nematophilum]
MGLGAKVKEILHSSESQDAARGEVDPNTPGSFPVDDMTAEEAQTGTGNGHEHNKLHKTNDPRGTRGHGHTDSGVGFNDTHDTSSRREVPSGKLSEPLEVERTAEPPTERRLHDNTNLASQDMTGGAAAASTKEHPYWGDLPRGDGVYNTVVGHGSTEEHNQRHRTIHTGSHDISPATTSSNPHGGAQMHTEGQPFSFQTTDPSSAQRDAQGDTDERAFGPGANEGLAGVAVAGAAGVGVYGLSKEHRTGESAAPSQLSHGPPTTAPRSDYSSQAIDPYTKIEDPPSSQRDVQNPYERTTGPRLNEGLAGAALVGTAGAGAYELDKKQRAGETPKQVDEAAAPEESRGRSFPLLRRGHKDKDVQENKRPREVTREHRETEDKSRGFFHRSGHKDDINPETEEDLDKETYHRSKAVPALAAAGAGGGAAYAVTRDRRDDDKLQDATTSSRYQDSFALGRTGQDPDTCVDSNDGPSILRREPADSLACNPGTLPYQQQGTHRDSDLAGGAAIGLGAGALAFRQMHSNNQDLTEDNSRVFQAGEPGIATTAGNAATHSHGTTRQAPSTASEDLAQLTSDKTPPTIMQNANEGKYNILSSGTPSGVRIEGDQNNRAD